MLSWKWVKNLFGSDGTPAKHSVFSLSSDRQNETRSSLAALRSVFVNSNTVKETRRLFLSWVAVCKLKQNQRQQKDDNTNEPVYYFLFKHPGWCSQGNCSNEFILLLWWFVRLNAANGNKQTNPLTFSANCRARLCSSVGSAPRCITTVWVGSSQEAWEEQKQQKASSLQVLESTASSVIWEIICVWSFTLNIYSWSKWAGRYAPAIPRWWSSCWWCCEQLNLATQTCPPTCAGWNAMTPCIPSFTLLSDSRNTAIRADH